MESCINAVHSQCSDMYLALLAGLQCAVGSESDCRSSHKLEFQLGHIAFVETDLILWSLRLYLLPLIQEGRCLLLSKYVQRELVPSQHST